MKLKIALAQIKIIPYELEVNYRKIAGVISLASRKGCDIICLPEECWSGPGYSERYENETAEFMKKKAAELTKKFNIYCVAGSVVEKLDNPDDHKTHNVSYLFSPGGEILGRYAKRHLAALEARSIPGDSHIVIETDFGKIGLQICRDILYPETTAVTSSLGAKIIFSPAFWSKFSNTFDDSLDFHHIDELQMIKYLVPARALENEVIMAFCNAAGHYKTANRNDVLLGYSQICGPFVGPIEVLRHNREKVLIQTVDTNTVDAMRRGWKIRGH